MTYQFELGLSATSHLYGLNTLLSRHLVIEPQEGLVRLHTATTLLVNDLEGQFEHITCTKC